MELWKRFSEEFPKAETCIMVFDGKKFILAYVTDSNKVFAQRFYCEVESCTWIGRSCYCDLILNSESFWMPLPNQPERSKREDLDCKDCEFVKMYVFDKDEDIAKSYKYDFRKFNNESKMRCSEHCGNTVSDK